MANFSMELLRKAIAREHADTEIVLGIGYSAYEWAYYKVNEKDESLDNLTTGEYRTDFNILGVLDSYDDVGKRYIVIGK